MTNLRACDKKVNRPNPSLRKCIRNLVELRQSKLDMPMCEISVSQMTRRVHDSDDYKEAAD